MRNATPIDAYFLCATPRTGSTLLCSLLKSSGVAGNPESYFRKEDRTRWSEKWGIADSPGASCPFSRYLAATIAAGRSENGVFAARIMWGTMEELVADLAGAYPVTDTEDVQLLRHAFGDCRFIYLKRNDLVAQAVSLLRAVQTDIWHVTDGSNIRTAATQPQYDFAKISAYIKEAEDHNTAWLSWFQANGIKPLTIVYEDIDHDPLTETFKILNYLDIGLDSRFVIGPKNRRISDHVSRAWIERFLSESR